MSNTMVQFIKTVEEINNLRKKEQLIIDNFEKSTCELSECFHWILKCELEGRKQCCLTIDTCPELYAKALSEMGFKIEEERNDANTLCGYYISWE